MHISETSSLMSGIIWKRLTQKREKFFPSYPFSCLFCQNWHYSSHSTKREEKGPDFIVDGAYERTACICYFEGKTNGAMKPRLIHLLLVDDFTAHNRVQNFSRWDLFLSNCHDIFGEDGDVGQFADC